MVAKCVPWGSASSLLAQDIMLRMPKRPRLLKNFPAAVAEIAAGPAKSKVIEVWFQDEARIGQKNKITRR